MYQEKRPTCVTVIGWAWIIIGILMCFSAIMALFASLMIAQMSQAHPEASQDMPAIFKVFPLLAVVQIAVAVTGLASGVSFLKLKPWSRNVLEALTWLLLILLVIFAGFFVYQWFSTLSKNTSFGFAIMEVVMILGVLGIYGAPLGIMVKYLRGDKVKHAIIGSAEPLTSSDAELRR